MVSHWATTVRDWSATQNCEKPECIVMIIVAVSLNSEHLWPNCQWAPFWTASFWDNLNKFVTLSQERLLHQFFWNVFKTQLWYFFARHARKSGTLWKLQHILEPDKIRSHDVFVQLYFKSEFVSWFVSHLLVKHNFLLYHYKI